MLARPRRAGRGHRRRRPERPTRDEARRAAQAYLEPFRQFPFATSMRTEGRAAPRRLPFRGADADCAGRPRHRPALRPRRQQQRHRENGAG